MGAIHGAVIDHVPVKRGNAHMDTDDGPGMLYVILKAQAPSATEATCTLTVIVADQDRRER